MNKKTKILMVVGALAIVGVVFGLYSYVQYEIKLYKTLVVEHNRISVMDDFLTTTFPDQVNAYIANKKAGAQANAPATLPAKPATK